MRDPRDTARGLLATVIGVAIAGAGLYLLSDEISGNLVPAAYIVMVIVGMAAVVRGLRVFGGG
jgi:hypothetical protein